MVLPTRGEIILDLIISSDPDIISDVNVGNTFSTSDHCYLFFRINCYLSPSYAKLVPNYSKADWETIRLFFNSTLQWDVEFEGQDAEAMYEILLQKIKFMVDNFIPKKKKYFSKFAVWRNNETECLIKQKKQKWAAYKQNLSARSKNE